MKYIIVLATLLFIGCTHPETTKPETNEPTETDSILTKSQQNLTIVGGANQKSGFITLDSLDGVIEARLQLIPCR